MLRITTRWDGWSGGPGFTALHFIGVDAALAKSLADAFWTTVKGVIPTDITLTTPSEVEDLDAATGVISDVVTVGSTLTQAGTFSGAYSAASGGCITWITGVIVNGRRLRGRTFIVPLGAGCYDSDGTLEATARAVLVTAATDLVDDGEGTPAVWHRPTSSTAADGSASAIVDASVADRVAILRSRRD